MSAVTIPDMMKIVEEHGLVAVPFDVDPETMKTLGVEELKPLITPKVLLK